MVKGGIEHSSTYICMPKIHNYGAQELEIGFENFSPRITFFEVLFCIMILKLGLYFYTHFVRLDQELQFCS